MTSKFHYFRSFTTRHFNDSLGIRFAGQLRERQKHAIDEYKSQRVTACAFCESTALAVWERTENTEAQNSQSRLNLCPKCGWWRLGNALEMKYVAGFDSASGFLNYCSSLAEYMAVLETFEIADGHAPLEEVARILTEDWRYSKLISARVAQDLVSRVFKSHMNCELFYYNDAVFAPDGGIDFVLVRTDRTKIAFQVKRRRHKKCESIVRVREFIGAVAKSQFSEGIFVTNAPLSSYAKRELTGNASNLRKKGLSISVVDGFKLKSLLQLSLYWFSVKRRLVEKANALLHRVSVLV